MSQEHQFSLFTSGTEKTSDLDEEVMIAQEPMTSGSIRSEMFTSAQVAALEKESMSCSKRKSGRS
jgi:hypothetical protein